MAADPSSIVLTIRLTPRDRALLEKLVEAERAELEDRGVEVSLSTVLRQMIRQTAKARDLVLEDHEIVLPKRRPPPRPPTASQEHVRRLLTKLSGERRGLAAEIARRFNVEPGQVSKFKSGRIDFPVAKIDDLLAFLKATKETNR